MLWRLGVEKLKFTQDLQLGYALFSPCLFQLRSYVNDPVRYRCCCGLCFRNKGWP